MIKSLFSSSLVKAAQLIKFSPSVSTALLARNAASSIRCFSTDSSEITLPSNLSVDRIELFEDEHFEILDPFKCKEKTLPIVPLFNENYQGETSVTLRNDVFGVPIRPDILHRCIVWQQAKKRAGNHKTKTLSEVSGSNRKILQQKGSGNARAGQSRSNVRRHGYKAMGPKLRSYDYTLPYRVRALGLRTALTTKWAQQQLTIIPDCHLDSPKSKIVYSELKSKGLLNKSCLILDEEEQDNFILATRNIPQVNYLPVIGANVFDILKNEQLIITKSGLEALYKRLEPYL